MGDEEGAMQPARTTYNTLGPNDVVRLSFSDPPSLTHVAPKRRTALGPSFSGEGPSTHEAVCYRRLVAAVKPGLQRQFRTPSGIQRAGKYEGRQRGRQETFQGRFIMHLCLG